MDQELKSYLQELKGYLDERFDRIDQKFIQIDQKFAQIDQKFAQIDQKFAQIDQKFLTIEETFAAFRQEMQMAEDRTAALIAAEIGSLHTQLQQTEMRLSAKIDAINLRVDTHAGLLQSGARQITRLFQFTEKSSRQWRALEKRLEAIERKMSDEGKHP